MLAPRTLLSVSFRIHRCVSKSHNVMLSTGRLYADEMLNECAMNVCTILLTLESCSTMKPSVIRSLNTVKYSTLHAIEIYLIVFMVNKLLSESESESKTRKKNISLHLMVHDVCVFSCNSIITDYESNIFFLDLTHGFNGLGKGNCKTRRETFKVLGFGMPYIRYLMVCDVTIMPSVF